jgi:hypothetical protein
MIRVGTDFQYQGQILQPGEIVFVPDHHYDEKSRSYPLKKLLEHSVDPQSLLLIFYSVVRHGDGITDDYNSLLMPYFTSWMAQQFNRAQINVCWNTKPYTFNFMINKPRKNREFLLHMINYFGLDNYTHTLCWKNVDQTLSTIENPQYQHLKQAVTVKPRQFLLGQEQLLDRGLRYGSVTNAQNYQAFLQQNLFEPSCVSLITEPCFYEREAIPTEKTLMSIWGGTLPIWVGGWCTPEYMKSLGFDVFDDIIDHSYQYLDDPYDRCYYAIQRNLDLLKNHALAEHLVLTNRPRFQHNLDLLKENIFLKITQKIIQHNDLSGKLHLEWDLLN